MPVRFSRARGAARCAVAALVLAAPADGADERPDFSGKWTLAPKISDDIQTRIEEATGRSQVKGAGGLGLLPRAGAEREAERMELRRFLLDRVTLFESLEIEQSPADIKIVHGAEDVRIFYFDREHVRNDRQGRKLRCRTRWDGPRLVIEEEGEDRTRIVDVLVLVPSRSQLVHGLRVESRTLEKPLELNLAYDKVTP